MAILKPIIPRLACELPLDVDPEAHRRKLIVTTRQQGTNRETVLDTPFSMSTSFIRLPSMSMRSVRIYTDWKLVQQEQVL